MSPACASWPNPGNSVVSAQLPPAIQLVWQLSGAQNSGILRSRLAMSQARKLIPLLDRVLIEKITAPTKTVGGILLPESAVQKVRAAMPRFLAKPHLFCWRCAVQHYR